MRAAISELPDGDYDFEDHVEGLGRLHNITVRVTVDGSDLHADFAGSAPQVEANFNSVEAVAVSCLYYAVRVATDPSIPANGGCYRPITMSAPAGSIVSAEPPAAVAAGNVETSQRIADALLGALAVASPAMVPAASQGTMNNVLAGSDSFAYYETVGGGQGGRPGRAGQSGIHTGMTNTKNTPIESLTRHYPLRITAYGLRSGSGGEGRYPGGQGIVREMEFLSDATVTLMGERRVTQPWGLQGGGPGAMGEDWLIRRSGDRGAAARQGHARGPGRRPPAGPHTWRRRMGQRLMLNAAQVSAVTLAAWPRQESVWTTATPSRPRDSAMTRRALLVGSLPFDDEASAMARAIELVGDRLLALPDGEIGERSDRYPSGDRSQWVAGLSGRLAREPSLFDVLDVGTMNEQGFPVDFDSTARLRPRLGPTELGERLRLGYDTAALRS